MEFGNNKTSSHEPLPSKVHPERSNVPDWNELRERD